MPWEPLELPGYLLLVVSEDFAEGYAQYGFRKKNGRGKTAFYGAIFEKILCRMEWRIGMIQLRYLP